MIYHNECNLSSSEERHVNSLIISTLTFPQIIRSPQISELTQGLSLVIAAYERARKRLQESSQKQNLLQPNCF